VVKHIILSDISLEMTSRFQFFINKSTTRLKGGEEIIFSLFFS
jgi:hypothetical protein